MNPTRRQFLATSVTAAAISPLLGYRAFGQSRGKRLTLLHLTDTHAQLETHWEYLPGGRREIVPMGGFARLKTAIDAQRATSHGPAFLVDGGDLVQGSGPAAWSSGEVMIAPSNALELDAFVPGNWEPVYGPSQFLGLMNQLKTNVVAYNFHDTKTGKRLFAPYTVSIKDGVKVVFIGLADPTTTLRQPPTQVAGLDSTKMEGLGEFLGEIRRKEQPDVLVAVTHTGLTVSRQIARENPQLNVLLSGHTHERTETVIREGNVLIVEAGSNGSFLGRLDLTLKPQGGIDRFSFVLIPIHADKFAEDQGVKAIVDRVLSPHRERMGRRLCDTTVPVMRYDVFETNADNLISGVIRKTAGVDLGMTNGFRFAPPVVPGAFTEGDLWNLLPLDARMKKGWVTGKEFQSYLERELELVFSKDAWKLSGGWGPRVAGLDLRFEAGAPPGRRIRNLKIGGEEVQPDRKYTVAGCEREGEPLDFVCRMQGVHDVEYVTLSIHDAMTASLTATSEISPERDSNARATDLPPMAFSQDEILMSLRSKGA